MLPFTITVLLVLYATLRWLRSPLGSSALRLCAENLRLFVPALLLLLSDTLVMPLFIRSSPPLMRTVAGVELSLSIDVMVRFMVQAYCGARLARDLAQLIYGRQRSLNILFRQMCTLLLIGWFIILVSTVFVMIAIDISPVGVLLVLPWVIFLYWTNTQAAPFFAALDTSEEESASGIRMKMRERFAANPRAWRIAVAAHLLPLGFVTLIWLNNYTIEDASRTIYLSATNFKVNAQFVPGLPLNTAWASELAAAIHADIAPAFTFLLGLVMAELGTICITAYALLGAPTRPIPPGVSSKRRLLLALPSLVLFLLLLFRN